MTVRENLEKILETLPEQRLRDVLQFVEFLTWQSDREDWQEFGRTQLARAYGPDEPEYTNADLKAELTR